MKLSLRLKKIAELVQYGSKLADIGTDHAALPIYLVKNGIIESCIATENKHGPLRSALSAVKRASLHNKISVRFGNGLKPLAPGEIDTLVIAGMGGLTMIDILRQSPEMAKSISTFIFQPMVAQAELRRFLINNGYRITDEKLVMEDYKFYEIIVSEHGHEQVTDDICYELGINLIKQKDPLVLDFINHKIRKVENIIANIKDSSTNNDRLYELEDKLQCLQEVKRCLQNAKQ
jgi:tRNA (adenine22-N1)-methyltransferase